jgi:hypothetical protein
MATFVFHIGGGVHEGAIDIGSPVEALALNDHVQLALYLAQVLPERQSQPCARGEDHDSHAVLIAQDGQGLMRGGGHLLYVHPHAATHIQQQQNVNRKIFVSKIANGDRLAIFPKDKVLLEESTDRMLGAIHDQRVDPSHGDVAAESGGVVRGGQTTRNNAKQEP